jgi:hypothetical protein
MPDPAPPPSSQPPPEHGGGGSTGRLIRAGQVATALTALLTAALLIWNDVLKPAPAPAVLTATVKTVEANPNITLRNYMNSHPGQLATYLSNARAQGLGEEEISQALRTPGVLVEYTLGIDGPAGQALNVTRTLYEAHTEARVSEGAVSILPPERYISPASISQTAQSTWIDPPVGKGEYFAEIDLVNKDGETIAKGRSVVFTAHGSP